MHGALPTLKSMYGSNSWCTFCRSFLGIYEVEDEEHIFLKCYIARAVWFRINDKLKNNSLMEIEISKENLFYKVNMRLPHAFFVSEVMWALWRNRCTNLYENESNSYKTVLIILVRGWTSLENLIKMSL